MIAERLSDLLVRFAFRLVVRPLFQIRVLGREHITAPLKRSSEPAPD